MFRYVEVSKGRLLYDGNRKGHVVFTRMTKASLRSEKTPTKSPACSWAFTF